MNLKEFENWVSENGTDIHLGFDFRREPAATVEKWLGRKASPRIKAAALKLEVFGSGPEGSLFAIWDKSKKDKPVVFLNSEGGACALAETFEEFLKLLTLPYDFAVPELDEPPTKSDMKTLNPEFLKWIKSLKLKLPKTGSEITDPAQEKHGDIYGWIEEAQSTDDQPKSATKEKPQILKSSVSDDEWKKMSVFDRLVYSIGKRIDDPRVLQIMQEVKAKAFKPTNPSDSTAYTTAKESGISEIAYSAAPNIREVWPPRKEGRLYVAYVTRIIFDKKFKHLQDGLSWKTKKSELGPEFKTETRGILKVEYIFKMLSPNVRLDLDFDDDNLSRIDISAEEEVNYITSDEEYEKEKPLVYIEDAFFAMWCAFNGYLNPLKFTQTMLAPFLDRKQTPLDFLNTTCGRIVWSGDFDQKKSKSLIEYYQAMGVFEDPKNYRSDIKACFGNSNHFKDENRQTQNTWENYDKIAAQISKRFKA